MKDGAECIQYHRVNSSCFRAHFCTRAKISLWSDILDSLCVRICHFKFSFYSVGVFVRDCLRVVDNLNTFWRGNNTQTALKFDQTDFVRFFGKSGWRLLSVEIDRWCLSSNNSNCTVDFEGIFLFALLKEWFVEDFILNRIALLFHETDVPV
jgi:hypothetical protein